MTLGAVVGGPAGLTLVAVVPVVFGATGTDGLGFPGGAAGVLGRDGEASDPADGDEGAVSEGVSSPPRNDVDAGMRTARSAGALPSWPAPGTKMTCAFPPPDRITSLSAIAWPAGTTQSLDPWPSKNGGTLPAGA